MKNAVLKAASVTVLAAAISAQGACVPLAIGAGATAGVALAQEGGISQATSDVSIRATITDLWFRHNVDMYRALTLTVKEGRVLIAGNVTDPQWRVEAVRLAWQADGVVQVINEIKVQDGEGVPGYMRDVWITTNLKSRLTLDKYIASINYTIETVDSVVYIMGIAQDQAELDRVLDHARNIRNVRNVVSYVRLRGQKLQSESPLTGGGLSASEMQASPSSSVYAPPQPQPSPAGPVTAEPLPAPNQNTAYDPGYSPF